MTESEKLEALIGRAIENGYGHHDTKDRDESTQSYRLDVSYNYAGSISIKDYAKSGQLIMSEQISLFNHDFARALFGEEPRWVVSSVAHFNRSMTAHNKIITEAEHHLQQAVISNNPIGYMYKAVFGDNNEKD